MKPITGAVLAGLMRIYSDTVNMVNAPYLAKERGLDVREVGNEREGDYHTLVRVTVGDGERARARRRARSFGNRAPRLVELFGITIEADLAGDMLYIVNEDAPGFIGRLGTTLGEAGINIGTFHLGRVDVGRRSGPSALDRRTDRSGRDRNGREAARREAGSAAEVLRMSSRREALRRTFAEPSVQRSLTVALIIGTVLNAINQGPEIFTGHWPVWWKLVLTYFVPFAVASYGSYAAFPSSE